MIKSILLVVLVSSVYFCQISQKSNYLKAVESLKGKDTLKALQYFKLVEEDDSIAEASFQIAMILKNNNDYYKLNEADDYYKKAIDKDPNNIKYRHEYGKYLEMVDVKVRDDLTTKKRAIEQYSNILKIDANSSPALYRIGRLKFREFVEYNKSYRQEDLASLNTFLKVKINDPDLTATQKELLEINDEASTPAMLTTAKQRDKVRRLQWQAQFDHKGSYEKYANDTFSEAEQYLNSAIFSDSSNYDAFKILAELYLEAERYNEGMKTISTLLKHTNTDFDAYLRQGLIAYKLGDNEQSFDSFQKALMLMPIDVKSVYLEESVRILLSSLIEKRMLSVRETKLLVSNYWNPYDPLLLTSYNERMLEHFSRVCYANLRFGVESLKINGWQTDRGESMIRYGFPMKKIRLRPWYLDGIVIKTDVWYYPDFTLAFTDQFMNNNYIFNNPSADAGTTPQAFEDTDHLVKKELRFSKPEMYSPNFKGPIFSVPYKAYQFAASDKNKTDVYVGYQINYEDTATTTEQFALGYEVGLFFNDRNFNRKYEKKETISKIDVNGVVFNNSLYIQAAPQSGNLAFEMIRKKDKGVAAYHGKFNVRSFKDAELQLSDLVFAKQLESGSRLVGAITRKDISIVANPTNQFTNRAQLYLYYEVYNLKTRNSITDFEQIITLQKKGSEGVLGSVLSVVGLDGKGNKVMLTSNYQTQEQDTQMYIQLDMNKYEPGNYLITVTINDKNTGKTVSANSEIEWRE